MNTVTSGIMRELQNDNQTAVKFIVLSLAVLRKGEEPSMIVGRPMPEPKLIKEDGGRTAVVPVPKDCPKFYAVLNETGGVTVMLADEY